MKRRGKTIVPRNPVAVAAIRRHAGAHDIPHKTLRRDQRQQLKKALAKDAAGEDL